MTAPLHSAAVTQLVAQLRQQADLIRARAGILASGSRVLRWHSLAGRAFHHQLDVMLAQLAECAREYDRAADRVLLLASSI